MSQHGPTTANRKSSVQDDGCPIGDLPLSSQRGQSCWVAHHSEHRVPTGTSDGAFPVHSPTPSAGYRWIMTLLVALVGTLIIALGGGIIVVLTSAKPAPTGYPVLSIPVQSVASDPAVTQPSQSPRPRPPTKAPSSSRQPAALPIMSASPTSPASPLATVGPVEFSLSPYFDNVGIVSDSQPTIGNLDGTGSAFSAQALAKDGASPGAQITYQGVPFTWPDAAIAQPDNVTAGGQTLPINGSGRIMAFLETAGWGPVSGSGKVEYVNGPPQNFTISAPDWYTGCPSATGNDVVLFMPYRNQGNGQATFTVCVFYTSIQLRDGSRVRGVVLPDISPATPASGQGSLHIFAITID